jgi:flagellar hook-basal body complex protein FliE
MSPLGSVSNFIQPPLAPNASTPLAKAGPIGDLEFPGLSQSRPVDGAPPSFGSIFDRMVGDVNARMEAGSAEQAKVLTGESTNLHQAIISMQEASVAFSLMVEVRNKIVESYQELMRMQV